VSDTIETLLHERRVFPPPPKFASQANAADPGIYEEAEKDWQGWWAGWANKLDWFEPWERVLEWERPKARWFIGGKLNACYNAVDRHVLAGRGQRLAFIAEGEPGDIRRYSYAQVQDEVSRLANGLKSLGLQKGDRVCIYMPMGPELAFAMLACARIGAAHSVVFGGFSADSLADRIHDAGAKILVTADGGWRRGGIVPLKKIADAAMAKGCPSIEKVLVLERAGAPGTLTEGMTTPDYDRGEWVEGRDLWWHELVEGQSTDCPCEPMDAEDLLFILYTSGSTGKPKGIMHTTGGYMTGVLATSKLVFDLKDEDVFWCTADGGWITGHSYVVYGPMANCATQVIYEGAPDAPDKDRFWRIIERHAVSILYTAPTAIRAFMKWGDAYPARCDLSSLRLLGTVGEPINPEAWIWYREHIGGGRCPIVDTWWQTETGCIMLTPLPGITGTKPGSATRAFPGIAASIFNEAGQDLGAARAPGQEVGGLLVLLRPWPSMLRGIWGDEARFREVYWSRFGDAYFAGDGAKLDADGDFWLMGRVDDIMLVAGHNISTMEVESALVGHPAVAEAAVIGRADAIKGQAIAAFVICKAGFEPDEALRKALKAQVAAEIGPIARPDDIIFTADVPKTRSGKIMRRLLRDLAEGRVLGDTTTLADPGVVAELKDRYADQEG
jgi:acetyl-CoA synthetase